MIRAIITTTINKRLRHGSYLPGAIDRVEYAFRTWAAMNDCNLPQTEAIDALAALMDTEEELARND